jgi:hypothetical protein
LLQPWSSQRRAESDRSDLQQALLEVQCLGIEIDDDCAAAAIVSVGVASSFRRRWGSTQAPVDPPGCRVRETTVNRIAIL